jgi:hypothetical protein
LDVNLAVFDFTSWSMPLWASEKEVDLDFKWSLKCRAEAKR